MGVATNSGLGRLRIGMSVAPCTFFGAECHIHTQSAPWKGRVAVRQAVGGAGGRSAAVAGSGELGAGTGRKANAGPSPVAEARVPRFVL